MQNGYARFVVNDASTVGQGSSKITVACREPTLPPLVQWQSIYRRKNTRRKHSVEFAAASPVVRKQREKGLTTAAISSQR
jgi:hypothetical protein